jgi:hypothetical protein
MVKRVPALLLCGGWVIAWWSLYLVLGPKLKAYGLARLGTTADYVFTYLGPELLIFLFGLVVVPLLYFLLIRRVPWWLQILLVPASVAGFVFVAYYDVVKIAQQAEQLCTKEAGLHVYRTVEAEGFYGDTDIRLWSEYGFKWLEDTSLKLGLVRIHLEGGEVHLEKIVDARSEYEYKLPVRTLVSRHIERSRQTVLNRSDGQTLGDLTYFHIFRGWADRIIDFGLSFSPPICWERLPAVRGGRQFVGPNDLVKAVIKPL